MICLNHILFPVDMSEQSRRAAPFVRALAERCHSMVTMLYVIELPVSMYGPPEGAWALLMNSEEFREDREAEFGVFLADEFANIPLVRQAAEGDPATQIDCVAKTKNVDLIMMPTHGYGAFRRLLLGSVTAKALHDAKCPVWTGVHTEELVSHDAQKCTRILCAIDTDLKDANVIRWAADFASQQHAELTLIHAIPGAAHKGGSPAVREFLFKNARKSMEKLVGEAGVRVDVTLCGGKPEQVIHNAALDSQADLVIIGRGVEGALGRLRSNAYAIIRESPCPVISV